MISNQTPRTPILPGFNSSLESICLRSCETSPIRLTEATRNVAQHMRTMQPKLESPARARHLWTLGDCPHDSRSLSLSAPEDGLIAQTCRILFSKKMCRNLAVKKFDLPSFNLSLIKSSGAAPRRKRKNRKKDGTLHFGIHVINRFIYLKHYLLFIKFQDVSMLSNLTSRQAR